MPSSTKRGHNDQSPTRVNAAQKRQKYTTIACNECRKRKTKCSGEKPCRHCGRCQVQCIYDDNYIDGAPKNTAKEKISALEHTILDLRSQMEHLSASVQQIGNAQKELKGSPYVVHDKPPIGAPSPASSIRKPKAPTQPQFIGPTSSAYNFKMANKTLQMMGIQPNESDTLLEAESALPSRYQSPEPHTQLDQFAKDPLLSVEKQEIAHALEVYKEEIHPIHPFLPLEETRKILPAVFDRLNRGMNRIQIGNEDHRQGDSVNEKDVKILKMIVASVLMFEGGGKSTLAKRLVDSVESASSTSPRLVEIDLQELQILTMTSIYYFHCDEPVLAWRTIGTAARIAIEMGLHRRESLEKNLPDIATQKQAVNLFWCIYVLDRRWSFGTGMPFVLQDSDIDPSLPVHYCEPYLQCMVSYGRICSKVWNAVTGFNTAKTGGKDTVDYLDFQIQQWLKTIPPELQLVHPRLGDAARDHQPRNLQRLRVLLYIRANHMRIFVHRHHILSPASISRNLASARLVMDIAKDTIRVLVHLRETSTIYETQQTAFNYFLVSAISAIFLGVCHAPTEFSQSCRVEFYSALGLLSALSAQSSITRRLWKSVKGLKQIAPRLGLAPTESPVSPPPVSIHTDDDEKQHQQQKQKQRKQLHVNENSHNITHNNLSQTNLMMPPPDNETVAPLSMPLTAAATPPVSDIMSLPDVPDIYQMGNDLTALFEALGHLSDGDGLRPLQTSPPSWIREDINHLQNGGEVSQLFEGLL